LHRLSNSPQCKPGVDAAPRALIEAGLLTQLRDELGYTLHGHDTVHNYTDLVPASDPDYRAMKNPRAVSSVTRRIADQTYAHAKEGRLVLTLGGDHSIAIGTIGGTAKAIKERLGREMAVIWVDAHADINTPETSGSGNIHGMPVSFLTGLATEDREEFFGWLKDENRISTRKLVYIGLRDVDAGEKRILRENGIRAFSMFDIDRLVNPTPERDRERRRANGWAVTVSERLWRWRWDILALIPRSICRLTWMRWIPCGRRRRVRLSGVG
jgi:arginase